MKKFLRIILAALLIFLGIKLLVPYYNYPIENFEYWLLQVLPISWKAAAVLSRFLVGVFFLTAFLLLFYFPKNKWLKRLSYLAPLMFFLPFIINTLYPEQLKDNSKKISQNLSFPLDLKTDEPVLLAYLSFSCPHCKAAALKLKTAQIINKKFPKVIAVSYNSEMAIFFKENNINFPLEIISTEDFVKITEGSFPKFELVQNNKIITKYNPLQFNYAVMDNLSK